MGKVRHFSDLGNLKPEDFVKHGSQVIENAVDQLNGNLEFDKNLRSQTIEVVFPAASTDVAVSHGLNKTDVKYFPVRKSVDCSIYDGSKDDTNTVIYLRSTQAATVTLILI